MLSFFLPGRNRKLHHTLRLTALVLMIALMYPGIGTAWGAPIDAEDSGGSNTPLYDSIQETKRTFLDLYKVVWDNYPIKSALHGAIERAVDAELNGKNELTAGIYLIDHKYKVINAVVDRVATEFEDPYNDFLIEIQKKFVDEYAKQLASYYKNELAQMIGSIHNPLSIEYINELTKKLLDQNNEKLKENVDLSLKKVLPKSSLRNADVYAMGLGVLTYISKDFLATAIAKAKGLTGFSKGAAAQFVNTVSSYVTIVSIAIEGWALWDLWVTITGAPDKLKKELENHYIVRFKDDMPQVMWEAIDETITEGFKATRKLLSKVITNAQKLESNEKVLQLTQDLSHEKKVEYCKKLAVMTLDQGVNYDDEKFLDDFGSVILNIPSNPAKYLESLQKLVSENWNGTLKWFELADPLEILKMSSDMQYDVWKKFEPTQDSLDIMRWAFEILSDPERTKAFKLNLSDIKWIKEELPPRYAPLLLDSEHSSAQVIVDIEKLKKISDKEDRRPWQNDKELFYNRNRRKIEIIGGLIIVFLVVGILARAKDLLGLNFGKKRRRKK